jgi:P27 family predicted phage terminase small subunit
VYRPVPALPAPTRLKVLYGNPGKRPLNHAEPPPHVAIPHCPKHLDAEARREWRRLAKELQALGLLTRLDRAALAAYCQVWSRWVKLEAIVQRVGEAILDKETGRLYTNPYLTALNAALRQLHAFGSEFGSTPASRTRLSVSPVTAERDELDRFLDHA